jgi:hypothetical protein
MKLALNTLVLMSLCSCDVDNTSNDWHRNAEVKACLLGQRPDCEIPEMVAVVKVASYSTYAFTETLLRDSRFINEPTEVNLIFKGMLDIINETGEIGATDSNYSPKNMRAVEIYNLYFIYEDKREYFSIPFKLFRSSLDDEIRCVVALPPGPHAGVFRTKKLVHFLVSLSEYER